MSSTAPSIQEDTPPTSTSPTPTGPEDSDADDQAEAKAASDGRWRVQDVIFSFGPDESYLISTTLGAWIYFGPKDIGDSFPTQGLVKLAAVVLTPNHGYIAVGELSDGSSQINNCEQAKMIPSTQAAEWVELQKQTARLYDSIRKSKDNDVRRKVSFTIGPGGSWFARRGEEIAHHALPAQLREEIQVHREKSISPHQVTLGLHDSYVVIWSDKSWSWKLSGYNTLANHLNESEPLNTVVLSPYDCTQYFLVREDGYVFWSLKGHNLQTIVNHARAFMQRVAKRDGKTFYMKTNEGNVLISPNTDYGVPSDARSMVADAFAKAKSMSASLFEQQMPSLNRGKVVAALSDRQNLVPIGAAAITSAAVVGFMAYPPTRRTAAAAGSSAASMAVVARTYRMPMRRAAFAAGLAALGTGCLCLSFAQ